MRESTRCRGFLFVIESVQCFSLGERERKPKGKGYKTSLSGCVIGSKSKALPHIGIYLMIWTVSSRSGISLVGLNSNFLCWCQKCSRRSCITLSYPTSVAASNCRFSWQKGTNYWRSIYQYICWVWFYMHLCTFIDKRFGLPLFGRY